MKKSKLAVVSTAMLLALAVGCTQTSTSSQPNTSSSSSSVQQSTSSVDTKQEIVNEAAKYLYESKKEENPVTVGNFKLPATQYYDGVLYEVEWKVEITSGPANSVTIATSADKDGFLAVDVVYDPFASTAEVAYTLTATIKGEEGRTASVSFDKTIPVFKYTSHADYLAAKEDVLVNVEAYVIGKLKANDSGLTTLFLQSEKGQGYYVYNIKVDPATYETELAIGNYVILSGKKGEHYGTAQLTDASYKLSPKAPVTVEPYDITSIYEAAPSLTDATLANLQGSYVTIKDVIVTTIGGSKGDYLQWTKAGKESYVRISSSGNPSDFDSTAKATLLGNYPDKYGYKADVTGIVTLYNGSFYLMPTSKDSIKVTGTAMDPTFEIDFAKQKLTVGEEIFSNLPTTVEGFDGSTVTWASTAEGVVAQDGKVTPKAEPVTTTLTATIKIGDQTTTKEFKDVVVKLPDVSKISVVNSAIKNLGSASQTNVMVIEGVIVAKDGSNRPYIMDAEGNVILVWNNSDNTLKTAPVGTPVKLAGVGTIFNGLYQFGDSYGGKPFTVLSVGSETTTVDYGTATPYAAAEYVKAVKEDKAAGMNGKYVKLTGVELRKNTNNSYYNLYYTPEGGKEVQIQLQSNGMNETLAALDGKDVVVYGYSYGTNGTVARITAVKIEEATGEEPEQPEQPEQPEVTGTKVTVDYTGSTTTNFAESGDNNATLVGLDPSKWAITTVAQVTSKGTNFPGLNKDGGIRIYASDSDKPDSSITFTLKEGTIKTVKITYKSGDGYNVGLVVTSGANTIEEANGVYTINGSTFTLANGKDSGQVRIDSIEIVIE